MNKQEAAIRRVKCKLAPVKACLDETLRGLPVGTAIVEGEHFRYFIVRKDLKDFYGTPLADMLRDQLLAMRDSLAEK